MSEVAWNRAFTQGSKAMQDRLRKVHAKNPKFQAWLQKSGHGAGVSVKQASKEVKPSARVKTLQQKSLKAYGATKGQRMGGEDGSGETVRDTVAPLTRDQHSKVQAAQRAAKAAAKKAGPKKPLTKSQRLAAIAAAVRKAKAKHDVPTIDPDDDHDDLRDVHQSLHIRRGYNEEMEKVDEIVGVLAAMDKADKARSSNLKVGDNVRSIKMPIPGKVEKIEDGKVYFRHESGKLYATHAGNLRKEEVELDEGKMKDIDTERKETARLAAQEKEPPFTPDKNPVRRGRGGPMSQAKWLAKQAMAKKMKEMGMKEEVESVEEGLLDKVKTVAKNVSGIVNPKTPEEKAKSIQRSAQASFYTSRLKRDDANRKAAGMKPLSGIDRLKTKAAGLKRAAEPYVKAALKGVREEAELIEQDDTMEKKEMAQTQLHFMQYAAKEILEFIAMGGEIEEWYQNKLSKVHSDMEGLHSYVEGEKRRTGMVREEVEQIDEAKVDPAKQAARQYASSHKDLKVTTLPNDSKENGHEGKHIHFVHHKDSDIEFDGDPAVGFSHHEGKINVHADDGGFTGRNIKPKKFDNVEHAVKHAHGIMPTNEEVEQIDELKKSTLKSYVKKASKEMDKAYDYHQMRYGGRDGSNPEYMKKTYPAALAKYDRRDAGVEKAKEKLAKEETETVEEKYMGFKAVEYGKEKFQAAAAAGKKMSEALDPVGKEDKDIDNDGDSDKTDVYLATKRKAIGKAIKDRLAKKLGK